MMFPNAIRYYRTPLEEGGDYREYVIYPGENGFVFQCWDCIALADGTGRGRRLMYQECKDLQSALDIYQDCMEKWEDIHMVCPKCGSASLKRMEGPDDFADVKPEGEAARKMVDKKHQGYFCWDCEHTWQETL